MCSRRPSELWFEVHHAEATYHRAILAYQGGRALGCRGVRLRMLQFRAQCAGREFNEAVSRLLVAIEAAVPAVELAIHRALWQAVQNRVRDELSRLNDAAPASPVVGNVA
jgi:hypothetical protein